MVGDEELPDDQSPLTITRRMWSVPPDGSVPLDGDVDVFGATHLYGLVGHHDS